MYQLEDLVFICRENRRRSGILLFLESPRFCLLSGMAGNKSGKSGRFPEFLRWSAQILPTSDIKSFIICTVGDIVERWVYSYFEKGCRKKMCTGQPRKVIWTMHCSWHCSCRTYFFYFRLALADNCSWPLMPLFQISLKNSELKTTHNTFRGCRVHFIWQPSSK